MMTQTLETKIRVPLLILRVTLGLFLLQWGLEKLLMPEMTAAIFGHFYFFEGLDHSVAFGLGVLQVLLALALIAGAFRNVIYPVAFGVHALSTISTAKHIFMPFMFEGWQHLFFTGVPVLAAFWLLYQVREWDTLSLDGRKV